MKIHQAWEQGQSAPTSRNPCIGSSGYGNVRLCISRLHDFQGPFILYIQNDAWFTLISSLQNALYSCYIILSSLASLIFTLIERWPQKIWRQPVELDAEKSSAMTPAQTVAVDPAATILQCMFDCLEGNGGEYEDPLRTLSGCDDFVGVEVWKFNDAEIQVIVEEPLPQKEIEAWALRSPPSGSNGGLCAGLKLLMGTRMNLAKREYLNEEELADLKRSLRLVLDAFDLPIAGFENYDVQFLRLPVIKPRASTTNVSIYSLDVSSTKLIWSSRTESKLTYGVLLTESVHRQVRSEVLSHVCRASFLVDQEAFLPWAVGLAQTTNFALAVRIEWSAGWFVRNAVAAYAERGAPDVLVGYASLSAKETKRAETVERMQIDLQTLRAHVSFFRARTSDGSADEAVAGRNDEGRSAIEDALVVLEQRLDALIACVLFLQKRTTTHLATLTNFIAQKDQIISIDLAKTSRTLAEESRRDQAISVEIARASKTIALESKRDSSSMKTIAAVTMVFLPGTFTASFFAMPLFDWDAPHSPRVNSHFWIYWIATIPLTVFTIAVWWLWFHIKTKHELKENGEVLEKDKNCEV